MEVLPENLNDEAKLLAAVRNRRRKLIFGVVFALSCALSLGYTFSRPPIYRSHAKLLIEPPRALSTGIIGAQVTSTERQIVATGEILGRLLEKLASDGANGQPSPQSVAALLAMVDVRQIANTDLLELSAEGPDPAFLPVLLNGWTEVYLATLTERQLALSETADFELKRQLDDIEAKVGDKRKELDYFRRQNDIVSMAREENQVLARLNSLTASLNSANTEEVNAKARLGAVEAAIEAGRPVALGQDARVIASLEQRAVELSEQIRKLELKYTPEYIAMDPNTKILVRQLKLVRERLIETRETMRQAALSQAELNYFAARQAAETQRAQLGDYRRIASDFTARFAEHESLSGDLAQLEQRHREAQDRLLSQEIDGRARLLRAEVVERAFEPADPAYPQYTRDAGISLGGSLALGLLAVLFLEFFDRPAGRPMTSVAIPVPYRVHEAPGLASIDDAQLLDPPTQKLDAPPPRELSTDEVRDMITGSRTGVRVLIGVLMSGVGLDEAATLLWRHLDCQAGVIRVPGSRTRDIAMSSAFKALILDVAPADRNREDPLWSNGDDGALSTADLETLISCAAHDGGLDDAGAIAAATLRHTYLGWLVRQGIRLSELGRIGGHIPPRELSGYTGLSPAGAGMSLDEMILTHPAMRALPRT